MGVSTERASRSFAVSDIRVEDAGDNHLDDEVTNIFKVQ